VPSNEFANSIPCSGYPTIVNYWQTLSILLGFVGQQYPKICPMTMNVNLTPQLEEMVKQKVASGLYTSASEVIREALRLMEEQDRLRAAKLEQLRHDISDGLNSGSPIPWNAAEMKQGARKQRTDRTRA
jgi:antitoxin ParD1/3/4